MRKLFIALAFMATLGLAAAPVAHAQTRDYKKKKAFIFKGDNIWGVLLKPGGGFISAAKKPTHLTLIEYRMHFKPEMIKLTEGL